MKAQIALSSSEFVVFSLHSPVVPKKRQSNEEPEYDETPQEKKLRLAKLYLEQLKEGKLVLSI